MEIAKSVDQRCAIDLFVENNREGLRRQGTLVNKWRRRGSRVTGPYYLLACRDGQGRQQSVYVGPTLVEEVRALLSSLQRPVKEMRSVVKARRTLRRQLRKSWQAMSIEVSSLGLQRHGSEFRGWSAAQRVLAASSECAVSES